VESLPLTKKKNQKEMKLKISKKTKNDREKFQMKLLESLEEFKRYTEVKIKRKTLKIVSYNKNY